MNLVRFGLLFLFVLAAFPVLVSAAITNTTVMTWVVPANKSHTISYGGTCTSSLFYFPENKGEDSDVDGNSARILPYPDSAGSGSACQGAAQYGMLITNNGNVAINVDANFQTNFSGTDLNLELKVWMGDGTGCGTNGFGGWAKNCPLAAPADTSTPVTSANCRDFNSTNATTTARLVTGLAVNDTNALCFSGEMTCRDQYQYSNCIAQGSYAHSFDTNAS